MARMILWPALLSVFLTAAAAQIPNGTPTEQVKNTVDRVLSIVRQHPPTEDGQLQQVIGARFDFAEMARRSLGPRWREITPEQQNQFVAVFTDLLKQAYLDQIKAYTNQKVLFTGEQQDGNFAVVETRIVPVEGEPIGVNYRLQRSDGDWKVYDVVIADVSLVNNYRSQFSRVLARNSFAELMHRMESKEKNTD